MPDIEVDLGLQLCASIETLTATLNRQWQHEMRKAQGIRLLPLTAPQATASPWVIDVPDLLMAKTGYYWDVRRLALTGWSAGSVNVYRNGFAGQGGDLVATFATPGVSVYGKAHIMLHPGDKLVVIGTGITGFVQLVGSVVALESHLLAEYLMLWCASRGDGCCTRRLSARGTSSPTGRAARAAGCSRSPGCRCSSTRGGSRRCR